MLRDRFNIVYLVLVGTGLAIAFQYFGSFTASASISLSVCFTMIVFWLYETRKLASFGPYEVIIGINFATLCEDLALEWIEEKPRDSRTFTAITPYLLDRSDRSNERRYMIGLYFDVEVPCVNVPWQPGPGSRLGGRPRVSFRPRYDGYHIEVLVDPEWWAKHKSQINSDICNLPIDSDGTITLAFLPTGYIPDHLRYEEGRTAQRSSRRDRKWAAKLSEHGWSRAEYRIGRLQHRYVNITCNLF